MLRARIRLNLSRADLAWLAILAIAVGVDLSVEDETGTLSQRLAAYRPPWLWRAVVVATALHLTRSIPAWMDGWSLMWLVVKQIRQRRCRIGGGPGVGVAAPPDCNRNP